MLGLLSRQAPILASSNNEVHFPPLGGLQRLVEIRFPVCNVNPPTPLRRPLRCLKYSGPALRLARPPRPLRALLSPGRFQGTVALLAHQPHHAALGPLSQTPPPHPHGQCAV